MRVTYPCDLKASRHDKVGSKIGYSLNLEYV